MMTVYSEADRRYAMDLYRGGMNAADVARRMGCETQTIHVWRYRYGIPANNLKMSEIAKVAWSERKQETTVEPECDSGILAEVRELNRKLQAIMDALGVKKG